MGVLVLVKDIHEIFKCECHSNEHMICVDVHFWENQPPDFCMSVSADNHLPWYRRIWSAIRYIFGEPKLSWHDVILTPDNIVKLETAINTYNTHKD